MSESAETVDRKRWMLAIDASTPLTVLALGRVDEPTPRHVDTDDDGGANQASTHLEGRVRDILEAAGIVVSDLNYVACGRGPGTFTGSRVAVAFAKGLALGLGASVVPTSTLAAVAASREGTGPTLALLDARRGELYAGRFEVGEASIEPLGEEALVPLETASADQGHAIGPGVRPALEAGCSLDEAASAVLGPSGLGLWRAARCALAGDGVVAAGELGVVYLRASYAEMGLNRPKRPLIRSPFVD